MAGDNSELERHLGRAIDLARMARERGNHPGAIFWSNVRRVVFGLDQARIREIIAGDPENFHISINSRDLFARGDHRVEISGPHLLEEARAVHDGFWG